MRLTKKEADVIRRQVILFDPDAKIYLFGSRVNDSAIGVDIDILVISDKIGFGEKTKIRVSIFNEIEEQKLDLVVKKTSMIHSFRPLNQNYYACIQNHKTAGRKSETGPGSSRAFIHFH